jgi:hypothetical protein
MPNQNNKILCGKVAYWIFFKRRVAIPRDHIVAVMQLHPKRKGTNILRITLSTGDKYTLYAPAGNIFLWDPESITDKVFGVGNNAHV